MDSNGRYSAATANTALPHQCICGAMKGEHGLIDLGFDAEGYGVVYLCHSCVTEIAMLIGLMPEAKLEELHAENGLLWTVNKNLSDENKGLKEIIHGMGLIFPSHDPGRKLGDTDVEITSNSKGSDSVPAEETPSGTDSDGSSISEGSNIAEGPGDSAVNKPAVKQEPSGVRSATKPHKPDPILGI